MNRIGRTLGLVFVVLALALAAGMTFTIGWHPFIEPRARPLTGRRFESTRLARGEYLVLNVTDCMGCHAEHDCTAHDAPVVPKTLGAGPGHDHAPGFPGEGVCTEYHSGCRFMPYQGFRALSDEDLASIIRKQRPSIPATGRARLSA
jgi:hypothetical protein